MAWADLKTLGQRNWIPTHLDDPLMMARYRVAAAVVQERGNWKLPVLREEVIKADITMDQLPSWPFHTEEVGEPHPSLRPVRLPLPC